MNSSLQSWLERVPEFPGLLAAYVVTPQQEPEVRIWSEAFSQGAVFAMHQQVSDVLQVLEAEQNPARKLRWIFDQTVVYFECRRDGSAMCLITTHEPWVGEGDTIPDLIADFRAAS